MKVIRDDIWLCVDCMMIAVNDDSSGIDSEERVAECYAGLHAFGANLTHNFDSEKGEIEFSWRGCDCCKSRLGGELHRFAILGEV